MANTYITTQGDTWDAVSYKLWGEECLFHHLIEANPEHIDVVLFPAGVELAVPEIAVQPKTPDLPPWMA